MGTKAVLYIVIPCYNEEKVLSITSGIFLEKMQKLIQDEKIAGLCLSMMGAKIELGKSS